MITRPALLLTCLLASAPAAYAQYVAYGPDPNAAASAKSRGARPAGRSPTAPYAARVASTPRPANSAAPRRPAYVANQSVGGSWSAGAVGTGSSSGSVSSYGAGGGYIDGAASGTYAGDVGGGFSGGGFSDGSCGGDCCGSSCGGHCCCAAKHPWLYSLFHTTGDMAQHQIYFPHAHGYYYFRPYNLVHVQQQQEMVTRWGLDARNPYDNRPFEKIYAEQEVLQQQYLPPQDPNPPSTVYVPAGAWQK